MLLKKKGNKMSVYDIYGGVQLKVGDPKCDTYKLGDEVSIKDGIYVGHEGIVVIYGHQFIAVLKQMFNKWGGKIDKKKILNLASFLHINKISIDK